jgi:MoxR-like ATPase
MAQARYLDPALFKVRIKEFMTTLDLFYAYPSNSIVCEKVARVQRFQKNKQNTEVVNLMNTMSLKST